MNEEEMSAKIALLEILLEHCENERSAYEDTLRTIADCKVCLRDHSTAASEVLGRFDYGEVAEWRSRIGKIL